MLDYAFPARSDDVQGKWYDDGHATAISPAGKESEYSVYW